MAIKIIPYVELFTSNLIVDAVSNQGQATNIV